MTYPTLAEEIQLWKQGYTVVGVDEVGRGCLAGPLYVCAAYFEPTTKLSNISYLQNLGINDSKKLSAAKRKNIYTILQSEEFHYAIGIVYPAFIDQNGITAAVTYAATQALQQLISPKKNVFVLFDGSLNHDNRILQLSGMKTIVHGDSLSVSIAAASIMAKVSRDAYMDTLSMEFPGYNWQKNKGYGTAQHLKALKTYGKTPHHRQLFLRKIF